MRYLLTFLIFTFISVNLNAQLYEIYEDDTTKFEYRYEIGIKYEKRAASSFYDQNGNDISELDDPDYPFNDILKDVLPDDFMRQYTTDFDQHVLNVSAKYHINKKWNAYLSIPVVYTTIEEKYRTQTYNTDTTTFQMPRFDKANFDLLQIEHFRIGTKYNLLDGFFKVNGVAELFIPAGFDNSILDDDNDILSDNAFEVLSGFELGLKGENLSLMLGSFYNWRDEELKDRIIFNANLSLTTVEETALMFLADYIMPFSQDDSYMFDPRETPIQEEIFDMGMGFWIVFNKRYKAEFEYKVRLAGTHTWRRNMFNATINYRF
jgi:hypothetical protein